MALSLTRARIALMLLLAALLAAGLWSYGRIEASLREIRATGLQTLLNTEVEAIERAVAEGRLPARGLAADPSFADMFRAARPGRSGESMVFDAQAGLLTESRHGEELRRRGLAPRLVVPETDELTRLAAQAVAGRVATDPAGGKGLLLDPYPGYLGREVVGAWRWLPEFDVGVAVEMEADEAYAPLAYLQAAYGVAIFLLALVWLSAFLPREVLERWLRRSATRQVGPYRLLRQIGEGALSTVWLARHHLLKRPAAVKLLKPQSSSDEWIARFEREVQLASILRHPNTITIYDYGTGPNGEFYYAMEYLEGLSLADLVERYGPLPPARAAHILRQVCASLWEAHSCGLVHRDIKPQNIMLCRIRGERDVVKVLDFGLVKHISGDQTRDLTGTLRILGTPLYMSPERIRNPADADARADIYALGAVGFHLLTGKRLFEAGTEHDLTYQVLHVPARLPSECAPGPVPAELDALIGRCLEKDPAARPQSIAEVAGALDALLVHMPWTRGEADAWWEAHWLDPAHPERRITVE